MGKTFLGMDGEVKRNHQVDFGADQGGRQHRRTHRVRSFKSYNIPFENELAM